MNTADLAQVRAAAREQFARDHAAGRVPALTQETADRLRAAWGPTTPGRRDEGPAPGRAAEPTHHLTSSTRRRPPPGGKRTEDQDPVD
jgi:hypothetical protein